jgi:NYN domain
MKVFTYVDNSNLYIEGCRLSAVKKRLSGVNNIYDAIRTQVFDNDWDMDYGRLHEFLCGSENSEIGTARLWGSPPPQDTFWNYVRSKGFDVKTYERTGGKEKKVDTAIAYQIGKDSGKIIDKENDIIVIAAGDKDYMPCIEDLTTDGFKIHVAFWGHAAREVQAAATKFINLDPHQDYLSASWCRTDR